MKLLLKEKVHSLSSCMLCTKSPEIDILWAEGIGRAWFCLPCFEKWKKKHPGEVSSVHDVIDGRVPNKWNDKS